MRILIAEDERDMNDIIAKRLRAQAYAVDTCFDGEDALYYATNGTYDAVILDIMMPKLDGYAVVQGMRNAGITTPVLFLSAKDTVEDRVKGLDLGANDYIVKPFSFDELLARIRVMLRTQGGFVSNVLSVGDLCLDTDAGTVSRADAPISLSKKEYALLSYMMRHAGKVLSRERIESHIWDYDYEGASNVIDVYIRHLRKKIDDGHEQKLIHTVRGMGYMIKE